MSKNLKRLLSAVLAYIMAFSVMSTGGMGTKGTALAFDGEAEVLEEDADVFADPEPQPDPQPTPFDKPADPHFITESTVVKDGALSYRAVPGTMVFGSVAGANTYSGRINNSQSPFSTDFSENFSSEELPSKIVSYSLLRYRLDSGPYIFSVKAMPGNLESEEAVSQPWMYNALWTASGTQLAKPAGLSWDAGKKQLIWDSVENAFAYYVAIDFYHNGERNLLDYLVRIAPDDQGKAVFSLPAGVMEMFRGWHVYSFTYSVTAIPEDMTTCRVSDESHLKDPFDPGDSTKWTFFNLTELPDEYIPAADGSVTMMIALPSKPVDVRANDTLELAYTCKPVNAAYSDIEWISSDPAVATVSAGKVTGVKEGKVTITAKSKKDPEISAVCEVNVLPPIKDQGDSNGIRWEYYENGLLRLLPSEGGQEEVIENPKEKKKGKVSGDAPWAKYQNSITSLELGLQVNKTYRKWFNFPKLQVLTFTTDPGEIARFKLFAKSPLEEIHVQFEGGDYSDNDGKMLTRGTELLLATKNATEIPEGITRIFTYAYAGQSVPYVIIPKSVNSIGLSAFGGCAQLTYIVIGNPEIDIEYEDDDEDGGSDIDAFEDCEKLTDVFFYGTEDQWKKVSKHSKVLKAATLHICEGELKMCTVTFVTNGGTEIKPVKYIKDETVASFPETLKEGYILESWYLDEALTQAFVYGETKITGDMTLYAKWRVAQNVTVIFYSEKNENAEWVEVARQTVLEDHFVVVPVSQLQAKGELLGWYKDEYYEEEFVPEKMRVKGDMSLYARWSGWTEVTVSAKLGEHELTYELGYNSETVYDTRKHVVGTVNGTALKGVKDTKSVAADIAIEHFVVKLDGEKVTGITIKKVKCSNNKYPSNDGTKSSKPMYMKPQLKYDKADQGYKDALSKCPKLKKTLDKMMKPSYDKKKKTWNYRPLDVTINRIELEADTSVYTLKDLSDDPALKQTDGILVMGNGKNIIKEKTVGNKHKNKHGDDDDDDDDGPTTYILKVTVPKLYYQRVIEIPGKDPVIKKIKLRAGEWKLKNSSLVMKSTGFDYYYDDETGSLLLNCDPEAWTTDKDGVIVRKFKMGYFTGILPISADTGHGGE